MSELVFMLNWMLFNLVQLIFRGKNLSLDDSFCFVVLCCFRVGFFFLGGGEVGEGGGWRVNQMSIMWIYV